jgi:uncharacterized membrane protein
MRADFGGFATRGSRRARYAGAMRTPASIAGHPLHPMLVTIPIGCWLFSLVCDLVYLATGNAQPWAVVAYYTMVGGIAGAAAAAIPGFVDLLWLPRGPARNTALAHMTINLTVLGLYGVNAAMRYHAPQYLSHAIALSGIAVLLLAVSGWLGGKMVYVYGVAVGPAPPPPAQPR